MTRISTVGSIALFREDRSEVELEPRQQLVLIAAVLHVHQSTSAYVTRPSFYSMLDQYGFGKDYVRRFASQILARYLGHPSKGEGGRLLWRLAESADINDPNFKPGARILSTLPKLAASNDPILKTIRDEVTLINKKYFKTTKLVEYQLEDIQSKLARNEYKNSRRGTRELDTVQAMMCELEEATPEVRDDFRFWMVKAKYAQHRLWFLMNVTGWIQARVEKAYEEAQSNYRKAAVKAQSVTERAAAKRQELITEYTYLVYDRQYKRPTLDASKQIRQRIYWGLREAKLLQDQTLVQDWQNELGNLELKTGRPAEALNAFVSLLAGRDTEEEQSVAMFNIALCLGKQNRWHESARIGGAADLKQVDSDVERTSADLVEHAAWVAEGKSALGAQWESYYRELSWEAAMSLCLDPGFENAP